MREGAGITEIEQCEQGERGSKFCSFCEKVIIKCPQEKYRYVREKMPAQFKYPQLQSCHIWLKRVIEYLDRNVVKSLFYHIKSSKYLGFFNLCNLQQVISHMSTCFTFLSFLIVIFIKLKSTLSVLISDCIFGKYNLLSLQFYWL